MINMQDTWGKCYLNTPKFCGDGNHFKAFLFPQLFWQSTSYNLVNCESARWCPTCAGSEAESQTLLLPWSGLFAVFPFLTALGHTLRQQLQSLCARRGFVPTPIPRVGGWEPLCAFPLVVWAVSKPRRLWLTLHSLSVCPLREARTSTSLFWVASHRAVGLRCAFSVSNETALKISHREREGSVLR